MGNYPGKERHGSAASSSDPFQTPPTSPFHLVSHGNDLPPLPSVTTPKFSDPPSHVTNQPITESDRSGSENSSKNKDTSTPRSPYKQRSEEEEEKEEERRQSPTNNSAPTKEPPTSGRGHDGGVELELLQECMAALGLNSTDENSHKLAHLLRNFLMEREQMKDELRSLKEKIQSERSEWLQFQSDLQVALVVADRLRAEADEELAMLREAQQDWERQLNDAREGRREIEGQVQRLKAELELEQNRHRDGSNATNQQGALMLREKGSAKNVVNKGERWKEEREKGEREATERARSISRPATEQPSSVVNGTAQIPRTLTTRSVNKNNNTGRDKLSSDQQDNLINTIRDKKEEHWLSHSTSPLIDAPLNKSSKTKPQEDFSKLLRRHGGSKRNSLLRWCQNRTSGYRNIDITNFSSSWVDGLAFCAVFHTYLPSHIPYHTLSPDNKKENLLLAFQTGESLGISASLTVDEMLKADGPDWQRVLGYIESIYRHFEM